MTNVSQIDFNNDIPRGTVYTGCSSFFVRSNKPIGSATGMMSIWKMVLEGDTESITAPGQFINISVPGKYLRRPISICDWNDDTLTILYRIVGGGTFDMSRLKEGTELNAICGLGNGFSMEGTESPLLVGGGVGLPPMLGLAKRFVEKGIGPTVAAGFKTAEELILVDEFRELGIELQVATMDGSMGTKGTVMDALGTKKYDKFYACGPKPMLKALSALPIPGELSVEERMGCGFGICMGCSCKTKQGMKRVCTEGPVFRKEDMIWE